MVTSNYSQSRINARNYHAFKSICANNEPQIRDSDNEMWFPADASYLLVGCLGGLGRSLTSWMMERGARNFSFISRTGTDKTEAAQLVESLKRRDALVQVFRADASSLTDVERVISDLKTTGSIRGVVHAAMVLQVTLPALLTLLGDSDSHVKMPSLNA